MRLFRLILPYLSVALGLCFFCWMAYYAGGNHAICAAANFLSLIDRILSSFTLIPPMVSWGLMGFLIGSVVYFVLFGAPRTARLRHVSAPLLASLAFVIAGAVVSGPAIEFQYAGKMYLRPPVRNLRPGQSAWFETIEFVWIPPGRFRMGSLESETGRSADESAHVVTLTSGFWMSRYEITQKQWTRLMDGNPSAFKEEPEGGPAEKSPVDSATWDDCQQFIYRLNLSGKTSAFRLPTEAEWEYACRAGGATAYSFGDVADALGDHAWYAENSDGRSHRVGQKGANAWGLYDMHGNLWEWCVDYYGEYPSHRAIDPARVMPWQGEERHTLRGGSWRSPPAECRAAKRFVYLEGYFRKPDDIGFRIVRQYQPGDAF